MDQQLTNLTRIRENLGWIPGLAQCWESGIAMSCGVGHRCSSDPDLLWLWCRRAAVALIQPLAGELSYVTGAALKKIENK